MFMSTIPMFIRTIPELNLEAILCSNAKLLSVCYHLSLTSVQEPRCCVESLFDEAPYLMEKDACYSLALAATFLETFWWRNRLTRDSM